MTTGRINQVTLLQARGRAGEAEAARSRAEPPGAILPRGRGQKLVFTPRRDAPLTKRRPTENRTAPVKERPSVKAIQLPPLSSPRGGPPQRLDRGPGGPTTRLRHAPLKRRTPKAGHDDAR